MVSSGNPPNLLEERAGTQQRCGRRHVDRPERPTRKPLAELCQVDAAIEPVAPVTCEARGDQPANPAVRLHEACERVLLDLDVRIEEEEQLAPTRGDAGVACSVREEAPVRAA
jgi:hypothetical protein